MSKGDPSSVSELGRVEDIEAITPAALTEALAYALKHHRIEIWCAGDFDKASLTKTLTGLFAIENREPAPIPEISRLPHVETENMVTEEQPVKQGKLCLGFTTDFCASGRGSALYGVFNEVFSSSPVSKLFVNVREKLSLCYYCHTISNKKKGTMIVTSGIEVENLDTARSAILNELRSVAEGNISEEELVSAKKSLVSSVKSIDDDYGSMISWYFSQIDEEHVMTPEEYAEYASETTVSDIMEIAGSFIPHTVYFLKGTVKEEG
jgi:predicted Zn-dependent peptidase